MRFRITGSSSTARTLFKISHPPPKEAGTVVESLAANPGGMRAIKTKIDDPIELRNCERLDHHRTPAFLGEAFRELWIRVGHHHGVPALFRKMGSYVFEHGKAVLLGHHQIQQNE